MIALGLASCEMRSNGTFTGEDLYNAFKYTTFEGASGSVVLDDETGTREPKSAVFILKNFVSDKDTEVDSTMIRFKSVDTDFFNLGQWESVVSYTFNDGSNDVPVDLPPLIPERNYPSVGLKVIGLIFCAIIFGFAIAFGVWTYTNRESIRIKLLPQDPMNF